MSIALIATLNNSKSSAMIIPPPTSMNSVSDDFSVMLHSSQPRSSNSTRIQQAGAACIHPVLRIHYLDRCKPLTLLMYLRRPFYISSQLIRGTNAYAIISSPRTAGTEAIVISASWLSRTGDGDGTLNLRGVATILSLAQFIKREELSFSAWILLWNPAGYSYWSKDIIFVINDGYLDGMQAWLSQYHGASQSSES